MYNFSYEDRYDEYIESEMIDHKKNILKELEQFIKPEHVKDFADLLHYGFRKECPAALKLADRFNLTQIDFCAIEENIWHFHEEYALKEYAEIIICGGMKILLEIKVCSLAREFIENYQEMRWEFCKEGQFFFPCNQFFSGEMTARSIGIALCIIASSNLSIEYSKKSLVAELWKKYYYFLRSYAFNTENFSDDEQIKIYKFID